MTVSLIRLDQLHNTDNPDDTLNAASIAGIEGSAVDYQDFLTGILSQIKRVIYGSAAGNWHDDIESAADSLVDLANRATLEGKLIITNRLNLTSVNVTGGNQYVLLDTANEPPDKNIAINTTTKGAVSAQLAGAVGTASLDEISGTNALRPGNLCWVFTASGDAVTSSDRRVYGLLQVGSAATDGNAFTVSGDDQGQISFVRPNATYDDLELAPSGDIPSTVLYAYGWRESINDLPENAWRGEIETADPSPGVTISLDSAYDGGNFITVDGSDVDFRLDDTKSFLVRDGISSNILQVLRHDTNGNEVQIDGLLDVNNPASADFEQGAQFDTADQAIGIGHNGAGIINSTGLTVEATAGDALVKASADVEFQTVRETSPLPLDDATAGPISGVGGGGHASIAAAIAEAYASGGVDMTMKKFVAGSNYAQGANIPGAVQDITLYPIDMETPGSVEQFVFLNGRLLVGGNVTTKNDCYVGTTPASGDLMVDFTKGIKTNDVIISVVLSQ